MTKVNKNFENLVPNYLFADIAKKTNEFIKANPDKDWVSATLLFLWHP